MFKYRVIEFFPDRKFGIAICTDDFNLRKIVVRDKDVIAGRLQIGSLVECEIKMTGHGGRYSGKDIRVLR
jgi:hypothetical protein